MNTMKVSDIRDYWPLVYKGLCEIGDEQDHHEEMYHLCRSNQAELLTCDEGFVIVKFNNSFSNLKGEVIQPMLIWKAYGISPEDLTEKYLPFLESLAKYKGCNRIELYTIRPGLMRKLSKVGYELGSIEMKKDL